MTDQDNTTTNNNDNDNNNHNDDWVYVYGKGVPPLTKARCNVRLLVDERHARFYAAAAKSEERRAIVDEIMHIVVEHNRGRFLKRQSDGNLLEVEPRTVRAHLQTMFSDRTRVAARREDRQQRLSPPVPVVSQPTVASQHSIAERSSVDRPPAQLKDDTLASETSNQLDTNHVNGDSPILFESSPNLLEHGRDAFPLEAREKNNDDPESPGSGQKCPPVNLHRSKCSPATSPPRRNFTESGALLFPSSNRQQASRQAHLSPPGNQIDSIRVAGPSSARPRSQQASASATLMNLLPPLPLRGCHVESAVLQHQCDNSRSAVAPNSVYAVLQCKCDNLHCGRSFSVCQFGSDILCPFCNSENRHGAGAEPTKNVRDGRGRSFRESTDLPLGNSRRGNGAQPHQDNNTKSSNNGKTSRNTVASSAYSHCEHTNANRPFLAAALSNKDKSRAVSGKAHVDNDEDADRDIIMTDEFPEKSHKDDSAAIEKATKKPIESATCGEGFLGGLGVLLAATAAR